MTSRQTLPFVALVLLVLLTFSGVGGNGFVPYDDDTYVSENPTVREGLTGRGLRWAFGSLGYASNWHPLTWLSHMADVEFLGVDPGRHHLSGLALYAAACALLLHVLRRGTGHAWRSLLAAALVALHPLRVESVAWAAERKDVLGLLFGVLTLSAWLGWVRRPRSRWRYAAVLGAFLAGLLSKPTLMVLPPLMLVLAWWPLGAWGLPRRDGAESRGGRVIGGTALLLIPALAASVVSLVAQRAGGGLLDSSAPPLALRMANALLSTAAYLAKTFFPRDLAVFYPFPSGVATAAVVSAAAFVAGVTAVAWRLRRRHPAFLAGWAWYLTALLPWLGLVPVGAQAMADRYSLLPSVGLTVAGVWLAAALVPAAGWWRSAASAGAAALVVCLIPPARAQVEVWRDGDSLFSHALRVTRGNWQIEHEYGVHRFNAKRYPEAERHFREALRLRPDHVLAHYNLGGVLFWQGRAAEAVGEYREAARLRPDFVEAHYRLGRALAYVGRTSEALAAYDAALALDPGHAAAAEGRRRALAGADAPH